MFIHYGKYSEALVMAKKKVYQPKRKQYNDLTTLAKEMVLAGEKLINFNGHSIQTKTSQYALFDGTVSITERV